MRADAGRLALVALVAKVLRGLRVADVVRLHGFRRGRRGRVKRLIGRGRFRRARAHVVFSLVEGISRQTRDNVSVIL